MCLYKQRFKVEEVLQTLVVISGLLTHCGVSNKFPRSDLRPLTLTSVFSIPELLLTVFFLGSFSGKLCKRLWCRANANRSAVKHCHQPVWYQQPPSKSLRVPLLKVAVEWRFTVVLNTITLHLHFNYKIWLDWVQLNKPERKSAVTPSIHHDQYIITEDQDNVCHCDNFCYIWKVGRANSHCI